MTGRLVVKLGSVTIEVSLDPGSLRVLRLVFEALGFNVEGGDEALIVSRRGL